MTQRLGWIAEGPAVAVRYGRGTEERVYRVVCWLRRHGVSVRPAHRAGRRDLHEVGEGGDRRARARFTVVTSAQLVLLARERGMGE